MHLIAPFVNSNPEKWNSHQGNIKSPIAIKHASLSVFNLPSPPPDKSRLSPFHCRSSHLVWQPTYPGVWTEWIFTYFSFWSGLDSSSGLGCGIKLESCTKKQKKNRLSSSNRAPAAAATQAVNPVSVVVARIQSVFAIGVSCMWLLWLHQQVHRWRSRPSPTRCEPSGSNSFLLSPNSVQWCLVQRFALFADQTVFLPLATLAHRSFKVFGHLFVRAGRSGDLPLSSASMPLQCSWISKSNKKADRK